MKYTIILTALMFTIGYVASSFGNSSNLSSRPGHFTAEISGSINGHIAGPGIIKYLPPSDVSFGTIPGYYFIADDTGVRNMGITFTIPSTAKPGIYKLVSAHPMDAGKEFEVRIDVSKGNETQSYQSETTGTITLETFPVEGGSLVKGQVKGHFEFTTEGKGGERITAKGVFQFHGE
jgi:hypothetical protein